MDKDDVKLQRLADQLIAHCVANDIDIERVAVTASPGAVVIVFMKKIGDKQNG